MRDAKRRSLARKKRKNRRLFEETLDKLEMIKKDLTPRELTPPTLLVSRDIRGTVYFIHKRMHDHQLPYPRRPDVESKTQVRRDRQDGIKSSKNLVIGNTRRALLLHNFTCRSSTWDALQTSAKKQQDLQRNALQTPRQEMLNKTSKGTPTTKDTLDAMASQ